MRREVRFHSNGGEDDKRAVYLLMKSDIPYTNYGPTPDYPTPNIEYGNLKYVGLDEIKEFILGWKNNNLPTLD